jgi:Flp pilus assembly protein TadB
VGLLAAAGWCVVKVTTKQLAELDHLRTFNSFLLLVIAFCAWPLGVIAHEWVWQAGVAGVGGVLFAWLVTERRYVIRRRKMARELAHRSRRPMPCAWHVIDGAS